MAATTASCAAVQEAVKRYKAAGSVTQLQKAADQLKPRLADLLAAAGGNSKQAATTFIQAYNAAFESFQGAHKDPARLQTALQVATLALQGLDAVRSVLKGRPFEVEVQHYSLVRKLLALKAYSEAEEQGWSLLHALQKLWPAASRKPKKAASSLPDPAAVGDASLARQGAAIVVGTVLNLLISTVEATQGPATGEELLKLDCLCSDLDKWLELLPEAEAGKQKDSFFRCWYKAATALADGSASKVSQTSKLAICKRVLTSCHNCSSASRVQQIAAQLGGGLEAEAHVSLVAHALDFQPQPALASCLDMAENLATRCTEPGIAGHAVEALLSCRHSESSLLALYAAGLACRSGSPAEAAACAPRLRDASAALEAMVKHSKAGDAAALQLTLRALNFLRKDATPASGQLPARNPFKDAIASLMLWTGRVYQAAKSVGCATQKHAYMAASALVLAAQIHAGRLMEQGGDPHPDLRVVCEQLSLFWPASHQQTRAEPCLKPAEAGWVAAVLQGSAAKLVAADMASAALPLFQCAMRAALSMTNDSDPQAAEAAGELCAAAAGYAAQAEGIQAGLVVCMESLAGLAAVAAMHPRCTAPLLKLLVSWSQQDGAPSVADALSQQQLPAVVLEQAVRILHKAHARDQLDADTAAAEMLAMLDLLHETVHHEGSVSSVVRAKHLHAAVSWDSPAAAGALQAAVDLSSGSDVAAAESHSLLALHRANQAVTLAGESDSGQQTDWAPVYEAAEAAISAWRHRDSGAAEETELAGYLARDLACMAGLQGVTAIAAAASDCSRRLSGRETSVPGCPQCPLASLVPQDSSSTSSESLAGAAGALQKVAALQIEAADLQQSGDVPEALAKATEALKLAGGLATAIGGPPEILLGGGGGSEAGWWQARAAYLACLTDVGRLWQALGSPLDANAALQEAFELARRLGCWQLAGSLSAKLAALQARCGASEEATKSLSAARELVERCGDSSGCSAWQLLSGAELLLAEAEAATFSGRTEASLEHLGEAAVHLQPLLDAGSEPCCSGAQERVQWLALDLQLRTQCSTAEAHLAMGDAAAAAQAVETAWHSLGQRHEEHPEQTAALLLLETVAAAAVDVRQGQCKAGPRLVSRLSSGCLETGGTKGRGRATRGRAKAAPKVQPAAAVAQLWTLVRAFNLAHGIPALFRDVSSAAARLCAELHCPAAAAFFLHASLGTTLRAQFESCRPRGPAQQVSLAQSMLDARLDLTPGSSSLEDLEAAAATKLQAWTAQIPGKPAVCSITACSSARWMADGNLDYLLLTRCSAGQPPLVLQVPVADFERAAQAGAEGYRAELEGILADSAATMAAEASKEGGSPERRRRWWKSRLALDARLATLLEHMDTDLLGPWRCIVAGDLEDPKLADAVQNELPGVLERLAPKGNSKAQPEPQALAACVLAGSSMLSHEELTTALRHVSGFAGGSCSATEIRRLAGEIRASLPTAESTSSPPRGRILSDASNMAHRTGAHPTKTAAASKADPGLCTPAPRAAQPTAATTARRRGIMSRMQTSAPAPTSSQNAAGSPPKRRRSNRNNCEDDGFVLHRGDAGTEMGELVSKVRGLALEAEAKGGRADPVGGAQCSPVLLVLDRHLQALPWESLPSLAGQRFFRSQSLLCSAYSAARLGQQRGKDGCTAVDLASTLYLLNPGGDLSATQAAFESFFAAQTGWEGKAGEAPPPPELAAALQAHDLYVYCGHGSGEQYVTVGRLRRLPACATALLMGCSSGRLANRGQYEPWGPILAYIQAGCPAAVANLWDVTDRDIDRFSERVLRAWLAGSGTCMAGALAAARSSCRLPHLIGAAPVCYGLPTVLGQES